MSVLILQTICSFKVRAGEPEPKEVKLTCYLPTGNVTKTGCEPYEGIIAAREEDLWKVAALYEKKDDGSLGDWIGFYEVRDTGGSNALRNGKSVDVFMENEDRMWSFVKEHGTDVYVIFYEAKG